MSTPKLTYFINIDGASIPVGNTKPVYDRQKKGWVTDAGVFSTKDQGEYVISATSAEVKDEALVAAPVAPVVTPVA